MFESLLNYTVYLKQLAPKACCLIIYYLNNNLSDSEKILNAVKSSIFRMRDFVDGGYHPIITKEARDYCEDKIVKVYSYEIKKTKSLLYWAKQAIRSSIGVITSDKLEKLNLSFNLKNLILKTDKLEQDKFYEIFS